jgi:hypothetical protein
MTVLLIIEKLPELRFLRIRGRQDENHSLHRMAGFDAPDSVGVHGQRMTGIFEKDHRLWIRGRRLRRRLLGTKRGTGGG